MRLDYIIIFLFYFKKNYLEWLNEHEHHFLCWLPISHLCNFGNTSPPQELLSPRHVPFAACVPTVSSSQDRTANCGLFYGRVVFVTLWNILLIQEVHFKNWRCLLDAFFWMFSGRVPLGGDPELGAHVLSGLETHRKNWRGRTRFLSWTCFLQDQTEVSGRWKTTFYMFRTESTSELIWSGHNHVKSASKAVVLTLQEPHAALCSQQGSDSSCCVPLSEDLKILLRCVNRTCRQSSKQIPECPAMLFWPAQLRPTKATMA